MTVAKAKKLIASLALLVTLAGLVPNHGFTGLQHRGTSNWLGIPQCQYDDYNGAHQPVCFTVNGDEGDRKHFGHIIILWNTGTSAKELPVKYPIH